VAVKKSLMVVGIFLLVWISSLALMTWLDANNFFLYLPRAALYVGVCVLLLPFVRGRYWRIKAGLAGVLLAWLLILPSVRWNMLKSFYIDRARLRPGMTVTAARQVMAPYVEIERPTDTYTAYMPGVAETPEEHNSRLIFIPEETASADWCVVYPDNGQVKAAVISPD
jgi:hypothetical protein